MVGQADPTVLWRTVCGERRAARTLGRVIRTGAVLVRLLWTLAGSQLMHLHVGMGLVKLLTVVLLLPILFIDNLSLLPILLINNLSL